MTAPKIVDLFDLLKRSLDPANSPFTARVRGRRGSTVTVYAVAPFGAREQVADIFGCEIDDVVILDRGEARSEREVTNEG